MPGDTIVASIMCHLTACCTSHCGGRRQRRLEAVVQRRIYDSLHSLDSILCILMLASSCYAILAALVKRVTRYRSKKVRMRKTTAAAAVAVMLIDRWIQPLVDSM